MNKTVKSEIIFQLHKIVIADQNGQSEGLWNKIEFFSQVRLHNRTTY